MGSFSSSFLSIDNIRWSDTNYVHVMYLHCFLFRGLDSTVYQGNCILHRVTWWINQSILNKALNLKFPYGLFCSVFYSMTVEHSKKCS